MHRHTRVPLSLRLTCSVQAHGTGGADTDIYAALGCVPGDGDGSDSVYCEMLAVHPNGDTGELLGSGCGNDEQAAAKDCYDDATRRATE